MHFNLLPITLVATSFTNAAAAEGLTFGHFNLEYTDAQFTTDDPNVAVLEDAAEYELNQFLLSTDIKYRQFDGFPGSDFSTTPYELGAGYFITPEVLLGLGVTGTGNDWMILLNRTSLTTFKTGSDCTQPKTARHQSAA